MAFNPAAGDSFLTGIGGSEGKALCWSTSSSREPSVAIENVGPILSLAYRPDGKFFAVGTRERKIWVHPAGASPSRRAQPLEHSPRPSGTPLVARAARCAGRVIPVAQAFRPEVCSHRGVAAVGSEKLAASSCPTHNGSSHFQPATGGLP